MKQEFMVENNGVVRMHIGEFFGVYDLNIRANSPIKITLEYDKEPTDLIECEQKRIDLEKTANELLKIRNNMPDMRSKVGSDD